MSTNVDPKQIKFTGQEIDDLKQRINHNALSEQDLELFLELIVFNAWLQDQLSASKLSIKKMKKILIHYNLVFC